MLKMKFLPIFFTLLYIVSCRAEDYDYPLEDDEDSSKKDDNQIDSQGIDYKDDEVVAIVSRPMKIIASEKSDVVLPCQVNSTDGTRLWTKAANPMVTLFQDQYKLDKDPALKVFDNGSLYIKNVQKSHQGEYNCSIMLTQKNQPSVVYTLKVRTSTPEIDEIVTENNRTMFGAGDKLSIICKAFGIPPPNLSWYKILDGNKERLPVTGEKYEIDHLEAQNSGVYQCIADNTNGNPVSAEILIDVSSCKPSTSQDYAYPLDEDTDMLNDNEQDPEDFYGDNNEDLDEPAEIYDDKPAGILTPSLKIVTIPGETVQLPCQSNSTEGVIIWQNSSKMLFQAGIPMQGPPYMEQSSNGTLFIHNIHKEDSDTYSCSNVISVKNRAVVEHHVRVLPSRAPVIDEIIAERTVLKVGDSLRLKCVAVGYPMPQISWHKIRADNTSSERLSPGELLLIENVKHRDAGDYACLADNKVLPLDIKQIHIKIEMKPVISVEQIFSNSGSHIMAELKCVVHAEPPASVVWLKNGSRLVSSEHVQLESKGHLHKLYINDLTDDDYATYVCAATNPLGKSRKEVKLAKTPTVLKFIKPEDGPKDVVLTWELQSKAPISEHEIHYKKKEAEKWERVTPDVKNAGENDIYIVKHLLKGLEPGVYEAKIRSKNTHGWSDFSDPMPFQGVNAKHGHHNKHNKKPHKEPKEKHIISSSESPKLGDMNKSIPEDHNPSESAKTAASESSSGENLKIFGAVPLLCISLLARL